MLSAERKGRKPGAGKVYVYFAGMLLFSSLLLLANYIIDWAVIAEERVLAMTSRHSTAQNAIEHMLQDQAAKYGFAVTTAQNIEIHPRVNFYKDKSNLKEKEDMVKSLTAGVDFVTSGAVIKVDGKEKVCLAGRNIAEECLEGIKHSFYPGKDNIYFKENVEIIEREKIPAGKIVDIQKAVNILNIDPQRPETYRVQQGDTMWGIAAEYGIELKKLGEMNKTVEPKRLKVGQELVLVEHGPLLTVLCDYEEVEIEEIPFAEVERKEQRIKAGERRLVSEGVPGKAEVTYRVIAENGEIAGRKQVCREILKAPRNRVVAVGTNTVLASRGDKKIYLPVEGEISSPYGIRHGIMHRGLDIAADTETPVVAMTCGRVISASYKGGYGMIISIDHGGGLVSRYAHLSRSAVGPGQRVTGGDVIGNVGSTGKSTGPHLHLEILIRGNHIDPAKYLW